MKIEEIDKNFKIASLSGRPVGYFDAFKPPFIIEGLPFFHENRKIYRLPENFTANEINSGALELAHHTAGVRLRFVTNSPFVALKAKLAHGFDMNHMTRTGSCGFDLYQSKAAAAKNFVAAVQINRDEVELERLVFDAGNSEDFFEYTLNFPLYGGVEQLSIGLAPDSRIEMPEPHKISKPILFYGSSITQGGCASRPGNSYSAHLCRTLDAPEINWGFSGSGKGEIAVAAAIGNLDLSCFVMDYDHNANSVEHLRQTHEAFFQKVRQLRPDLPIVMLSACNIFPYNSSYELLSQRREIIRQTYLNALKNGDRKVWFIDGAALFGDSERDASTVDGCHPNDLGFYRMYQNILPAMKQIFSL